MFTIYRHDSRNTSILGLVAINCPKEAANAKDQIYWAEELLTSLAKELNVSSDQVQAFLPFPLNQTFKLDDPENSIQALSHPFLTAINFDFLEKCQLLGLLIMFLILKGKYDGRGRSLIRNIIFSMGFSEITLQYLEYIIIKYLAGLNQINESVSREQSKKTRKQKYIRYAKIGVASLGAGALLAVTGGLAAPAIAGALLVMGSASAAAAISVGTMATLFGSAGAGLAGYKMMKRTRGVEEFSFEGYGDKGKLSIMIFVSGWLEEEEDYKRSLGVVPDNITPKERLERYYSIHCPERLSKIDSELDHFQKDIEHLYDQLHEFYGSDPRHLDALIPAKNEMAIPAEIITIMQKVIQTFEKESTIKDNKDNKDQINKSESSDLMEEFNKQEIIHETKDFDDDDEDDDDDPDEIDDEANAIHKQIANNNKSIHTISSFGHLSLFDEEEHLELQRKYWHWQELAESETYELYLLRWETKLQLELGQSIITMIKNLSSSAVQNVLAATVLTTLASAVLWPAIIIKFTDVIDNLWTIAIERADQAGIELAEALLSRNYGNRGVTLVGYSLGARVIYTCLRHLANILYGSENPDLEKEDEVDLEKPEENETEGSGATPTHTSTSSTSTSSNKKQPAEQGIIGKSLSRLNFFGSSSSSSSTNSKHNRHLTSKMRMDLKCIVQDVVLLGLPVSRQSKAWKYFHSIVGGRIINGYSNKDLMLGVMYRWNRFKMTVSGVAPVEVEGIENVDLSDIIDKHTDYGKKMKEIFVKVNLSKACP